ncbi:MAG: O-antigen ligase family protein [Dorea sp.]|jgi:O-antigen ligase|nr:O-antigen ligase family protein [Dorea sp.]
MNGKIKITPEAMITFLFCLHCILIFKNNTKYFNLAGSYYLYILMIPLFILSFRNCNKFQIIVGTIILYTLVSFILKGGSQISALLLFWTIMFFFVGYQIRPQLYLYIKDFYCISSIIMSVLLLIQHRHPYTGSDSARYGLFYAKTEFYDVNFTATFLTIPTIIMFIDFYDKNVKYPRLMIGALAINLLSVYLLGSRSGLVIVFGSLFVYALTSRNKKYGLKLVYLIGGALLLTIAVQFLPDGIITRILSKGIIDGKTSTRYISWMYGMEAFRENPVWGNGVYSTVEQINKINYWGTAYTAHNTFISFLAMYGIVGSIPIFIFLAAPVYYAIKNKYELYFLILYLGFMAQMFVIEAGFSEIMLIPLIFFWTYINSSANEIRKKIRLQKKEDVFHG